MRPEFRERHPTVLGPDNADRGVEICLKRVDAIGGQTTHARAGDGPQLAGRQVELPEAMALRIGDKEQSAGVQEGFVRTLQPRLVDAPRAIRKDIHDTLGSDGQQASIPMVRQLQDSSCTDGCAARCMEEGLDHPLTQPVAR